MLLFNKFVTSYIPKLATVGAWLYFIRTQTALGLAIGFTLYSVLLFLVEIHERSRSFDGIIELTESQHGAKSFQLIVNKDPETFKDQDKVVFIFKNAS